MFYKDAAEKAGFEFFPGNTNGDAAKESEMLNTYVTQGYKGVAISPISETASLEVLKSANQKGLLIGISNHKFENADYITGAYTSDNYELGKSTGEACVKFINEKLGGKAKIAVLQFKSLLPEQSGARSSGFLDAVKTLPGVEIVTDQDAWLQDKAITVAGDIITANPDINIIWSANEGGTIGATMAVKNAGKEGFPVTTLPPWYNYIGASQLGPIPVPAILLLIVFIITLVIMNYTKFGREVYAVGGNPEAARFPVFM